MRYFVILLVLIGVVGTAYAESQITLTPFDVYLSSGDFTTRGPNHNILVLDRGNSTSVNVYVKNNDDIPHKIVLSSPTDSNSSTFSMFEFRPSEVLVLPHQTNSAKLHMTVSYNTDTHSTFVTFLGQGDVFGMKGAGFYLVVDDYLISRTDYSMRTGLPGPAFSYLITDILENDAEKIISNGLGTPRYLPQGYQFRGVTDWGDSQQFVYSKSPVSNQTESIQFWKEDGMMVFYGVDGPNVNNTKSLPFKVAQDESQQIMINGLLGTVTEQTTRKVMESDVQYKVPSDLYLFDDDEKYSVSIKANLPLEEILKIAASIPQVSSDHDESRMTNTKRIEDANQLEQFLSPLKQFKSGTAFDEIQCNDGKFIAFKIDNSKPACVSLETLHELISREWAFPHASQGGKGIDANSTKEYSRTCGDDQVAVQSGYFSYVEPDVLEIVNVVEKEIDGYSGFVMTIHNPTDSKIGGSKVPGFSLWIDCIDHNASNYDECLEPSHYLNKKNWPILECRTLDGKRFFIDENEEMAKNSGIEIYTINYMQSHSIEFVGKTDRVDQEISFTVMAPNGDVVLTWTKFAPNEGEFRITVTTEDPLWKQQDGTYTIIAKQDSLQYYVASSEFKLKDGQIIQ